MTIITNSPNQFGESDDQHALDCFAKVLGKTKPYKLRAVKKGRGTKLIGDDLSRAEKLDFQGYDIYSVINDGGDKDTDITRCPALFVEFDDKPKDFQLNFWKSYGLPEPTLVVDSGNKSLHTYWALTEPIHPETWSTHFREGSLSGWAVILHASTLRGACVLQDLFTKKLASEVKLSAAAANNTNRTSFKR